MPKTIILAEAHFDPIARELVLNNFNFFVRAGYKHFAFEHDFGKSLEFEIAALKRHLDTSPFVFNSFMQGIISATELTHDLLYPLLSYPSNKVLYELFLKIQASNEMCYQGIDKPLLGDRFRYATSEVLQLTNGQTDVRSDFMADKLLATAGRGVIAIVGASHAPRIQEQLIEKLGLEQAQEQFTFVVPFSLLEDPRIDIRTAWLDQASIKDFAALQSAFPLGQINLFGSIATTFAEQSQSTNERFQEYVRTRCWGEEVTAKRCTDYVVGYLYRLFSGSDKSAATKEYLQITDRLKKTA